MAPRRKSQADSTAAAATAIASSISDKDENTVMTADDEVMAALEEDGNASTARTAAPRPVSFVTKQQKDAASGADGIDQYELARTQVTKVSKSAIPDNIQLRKEVILGLIKSSTIFINYLASAALDKTHEAGNKTLSATHVINAFKEMGFPKEYAEQLKKEYNDKVKAEADRAKASKAAKADAAKADEQTMEVDVENSREEAAVEAKTAEDESMAVDLSKMGADEEDEEDEDEEDEEEDDEEGGEDEGDEAVAENEAEGGSAEEAEEEA